MALETSDIFSDFFKPTFAQLFHTMYLDLPQLSHIHLCSILIDHVGQLGTRALSGTTPARDGSQEDLLPQ